MGASILKLVALFDKCAPDQIVQSELKAIVSEHNRWVTAHSYRQDVRTLMLNSKDKVKLAQYAFAEACLESIYNETDPDDPFDSVSPYWVVPSAASLAKLVGVPIDAVLRAI